MAGLAPGSGKNISKTKLQAFSIGQMNLTKKKSKRIEDELKKKEQEKETAKIFEEFVASFEGTPSTSKAFIRGNTINPETRVERSDGKTGKLYKPTSKIAENVYAKQKSVIEEAQKARAASQLTSKVEYQKNKLKKEKEREKQKKSNLELFKEELRVLQQQREERHKAKKGRGSDDAYDEPILPTPAPSMAPGAASDIRLPAGMEEYNYGSHDYGDPNTTNIFLGSINPKVNEEHLCKEFVQYGPLASVKIMWPRTDAERQRNRNCGFVAFMNRRDAERAMKALNGKEVMNYEMKLGWGKAVVLPPHPVYIPEAMLELTMPPPPSGLPFNAQLKKSSKRDVPSLPPPGIALTLEEEAELAETLKEAVVKVVIPTERPLLQVIHRMIEFVVNEGPMFEAMIMNREINNPMFRFLFDNQTPAHVYYRWKLFSILQGDSITKWTTDEFYMFKDGSVWRPPPINPYQQGMPEALVPRQPFTKSAQAQLLEPPKKKILTNHQRDKLEDHLRAITMDRYKIGETMVYCLDHADSAEEIVECIAESLSIPETPLPKKIGRLFLVSDILFNSSSKVSNASFFRKFFEGHLPVILQDVRETYQGIQQRLKAEQFKQRVMACFRSWEDWAVYPNEFLVRLQNIFLGFLDHDSAKEEIQIKDPEPLAQPFLDLDGVPVDEIKKEKVDDADFDGVPLETEQDIDGAPLPTEGGEDLDGAPLDGDPIDGAPLRDDEEDDDQRSFTSSGGLKGEDGKGFKEEAFVEDENLFLQSVSMETSMLQVDWLLELPEDLDMSIAQRNFEESVDLILRANEYLEQVPVGPSLKEMRARVDHRVKQLTDTLTRELQVSPDRSLRGGPQVTRRAVVQLIRLGKSTQACDLFLKNRSAAIKQSLRQLRIEGATSLYVTKLCHVFFNHIIETGKEFRFTFSQNQGCYSAFVVWAKAELRTFVHLFSRQALAKQTALVTVAECVCIARTSCALLSTIGLDLLFALNGLTLKGIREVLVYNKEQFIEASRHRNVEERWYPLNLKNPNAANNLVRDMQQLGFDKFNQLVYDSCFVSLANSTVAFTKVVLSFVKDALRLYVPELYPNIVEVLVEVFDNHIQLVEGAVTADRFEEERQFILKNVDYLFKTLLPLIEKKIMEVAGRKVKELQDIQKRSQAISSRVRTLGVLI